MRCGRCNELSGLVDYVEILRDGEVHRCFFPVPDVCLQVREMESISKDAQKLIESVSRENPAEKAKEINERYTELVFRADHYRVLFASPFCSFLVANSEIINGGQFYVAFVQMAIVLLFYGEKERPYDGYQKSIDGYEWGAGTVVLVLSWLQVIASTAKLVQHLVVELPVMFFEHEVIVEKPDSDSLHRDLPVYARPPKPVPQPDDAPSPMMVMLRKACRDFWSWYFLAFLCLAVACTWSTTTSELFEDHNHTDLTFAAAFLLFDYYRMPAGMTIVEAIIVGGPGLLNSFKCGVVLIFIYGCLSFWIFQDEIQVNNGCQTLYMCVMLGFEAGLHGDMAPLHRSPTFCTTPDLIIKRVP